MSDWLTSLAARNVAASDAGAALLRPTPLVYRGDSPTLKAPSFVDTVPDPFGDPSAADAPGGPDEGMRPSPPRRPDRIMPRLAEPAGEDPHEPAPIIAPDRQAAPEGRASRPAVAPPASGPDFAASSSESHARRGPLADAKEFDPAPRAGLADLAPAERPGQRLTDETAAEKRSREPARTTRRAESRTHAEASSPEPAIVRRVVTVGPEGLTPARPLDSPGRVFAPIDAPRRAPDRELRFPFSPPSSVGRVAPVAGEPFEAAPPPPSISVTIGRIEIRAASSQTPPKRPAATSPPAGGSQLERYLRGDRRVKP